MSTGTTTRTEPAMRHDDWMAAAAEEYRRLDVLLGDLDDEDWRRPTDCAKWTVHDVLAHLAGEAESTARMREFVRQAWIGRRLRDGGPLVDGINAVQVRDRATATPAQLRSELRDAGTRGLRARRRIPAALRAIPMPFGPPIGTQKLGHLTDRIYTRDVWMHRIDVSHATGRPLELTAEHDGRLVADIVAEWADVHGQPFSLTLTGPAGGTWSRGTDGEVVAMDAIEFCRILAGRGSGDGLLRHTVGF